MTIAETETKPANGIHVLKVWIDQDLCTSDGLCTQIVPPVFTLLDDGLAYVKSPDGKIHDDPGKAEGLAVVEEGNWEGTIEAAEECPGECIFLDIDGKPVPFTEANQALGI